MRMVHAIHENTYEGAQEVRQTGVGGDAKIVYALLSGMVSDKVEYPVREYATNAWEVSPPGKPPEIELPTRFNLTYRIRDYGPGLSHRFMMNRYAKIGDSTKDNDDDAVGGWGFGSKAALAYLMRSDGAGSFTVISRHKGFRRTYSIGVSDVGKIQIQFLGEWPLEDEDKGTGLEIMFPVRPEDQQRFHDHAKEIYWSFSPRPKVTPAIDFGTPKVLHKGDGWTVYDANTVPFYGPQVQLGPVMYPIDMSVAPSTSWVEYGDCIVFDCKIGTISVSASRESLQYDDRTETGLRALFDHYAEDWMEKARAAVNAEPNFFKAWWKAEDIAESLGNRGRGMARQIGWRGFRFMDSLFSGGIPAKAALWPEVGEYALQSEFSPVTFKAAVHISPGELTNRTVVIQHNTSRSRERFEAAGLVGTKCLWVRCKRADLEATLDAMGRPEYIVLDSFKLEKLAPGKREKRPESVVKRKIISHDFQKTTSEWTDTDEEQVYVTVQGRGRSREIYTTVDGKTKYLARYEASDIMMKARQLDLIERDLKLVQVDRYEDVPDHWRSLGDVIAEAIDEKMDVTQVSPVIPWNDGSFPTVLRHLKFYRIDLGCAPQELRDLYYSMVAMLKTRETITPNAGNVHDQLAALNLKLTGTDVKSVAKDPTLSVRTGFEAFMKRHPILTVIMRDIDRRCYTKIDEQGQRDFDTYFNTVAK